MAVRKQTSSPFEINFSIIKVINNRNRQNVIYSEISDQLSDYKNDNVQRISESNFVRETKGKRSDRQHIEHIGNGRVSKKPRFLSR